MSAIVRAFDRADDYDRHAGLQRDVAERLAARIAALPLPPAPRVLEIGCGTGLLGAALLTRLPGADWLMTDLAPAMVARAAARFADRPGLRFAVMNGAAPDAAGPFDLICSSLAAQWFADLPGALARQAALLAPGGHLMLAAPAAGSFAEWRQAHALEGLSEGTPDYPTAEVFAAMLPGSEAIAESIVVAHADARAFVHALKAIGAGTPRPGHRPLAPSALRAVMRRFDAGGARVTYRIAFCHYRRPA
ncbi:MAG TPA: methyltransferase [Sphingomonas sp.]